MNEQLVDRGIRHAVFLEKLKTNEANRIVRLLHDKVQPDLLAQLQKLSIKSRGIFTHRMKAVQDLIDVNQGIISGGIRSARITLQKQLGDIAISEAEFVVKSLKDAVPLAIDFVTPAGPLLRSIVTTRPFQGELLDKWFAGLSQSTQRSLTQQLRVGLAEGESIPAISKRVREVMGTTIRQATSITRTAVNHVTTQARELTYEANFDIISKVEWLSTLDHRTTEICISRDGKTFPVGEGPRPPAHHQCRSTTVPITKSFQELGIPAKDIPASTRASMNGQVPAKQTYPQWLKKQSPSVQNEVLGKGKATLFRSGKLDISKFNGVGNKPFTLQQLQAKEGLAVTKAIPKSVEKPVDLQAFAKKKQMKTALKSIATQETKVLEAKEAFNKEFLGNTKVDPVTKTQTFDTFLSKQQQVGKLKASRFTSQSDWEASLALSQKDAINQYTGVAYGDIRRFQQGVFNERISVFRKDAVQKWVKDITSAFETAPQQVGTVHRSIVVSPEVARLMAVEGNIMKFDAFTSTSRLSRVGKQFGRGEFSPSSFMRKNRRWVEFEIDSKSGVDIANFSGPTSESETLFIQGSKFRIKAVIKETAHDGWEGYRIVLEEL